MNQNKKTGLGAAGKGNEARNGEGIDDSLCEDY
jgi:hypothetical protein